MTWRVARGGTRVSGPAREAPADDALAAAAVSRTPSAERATRDAERHPRLDLGWLLLLLAGLGFVVLVGAQLWRPLMYDDVNFYLAGKQVAETGRPFGNQGWMGDRDDFSQREQWGLWHPPLYVYLLGLFARVGGATAAVMRLPGLLGGLAAGGLTGLLTYDLTRGPPAERRLAAGVAAVLVLLCPLSIQSALILDIDFSLLLPLTLLFLVLYVRLEATRRSLLLAPLLALLLWAKMTNPLPLLAAIVTWQVLHGRFLRAARDLVGLGLGGALLFGLTYMPAGRLLGFPLDMPFGVNLSQWQGSADVARRAYTSPGAFVEALQPTVLWLGPGLVGLGLLGIGVRSACLVREWRLRRVDLLIGLLVLLVVGYVNKYAGWLPKYEVSMAPLLAVLGAPLVARALTAVGAPRDARARPDVGTPHGAATAPAARQSVLPALAGSPGETPPAGPRSAPPARAGTPVEQASEPGMMRIHRPPTAVVLGLLAGLSVAAFVVDAGLVADSWALKRMWSIDPTAGAWFLALVA
ncbi:MAG TPA: hypothetical protein VFA49_14705, partial [Chloroflexota bacterium]|nr:hypothetical protein [Chloroflexota bacterium]